MRGAVIPVILSVFWIASVNAADAHHRLKPCRAQNPHPSPCAHSGPSLSELQARIAEAEAAVRRAKDDAQGEIKKAKDGFDADLKKAKDDSDAELKKAKDGFDAEIKRVRDESDAQIAKIKTEAEAQVAAAKKRADEREQAADTAIAETAKERRLVQQALAKDLARSQEEANKTVDLQREAQETIDKNKRLNSALETERAAVEAERSQLKTRWTSIFDTMHYLDPCRSPAGARTEPTARAGKIERHQSIGTCG